MSLYEHVFLARQDVSPQQVESLTETFKAVIEEHGGTVGKTEYWGLKSTAYRIRKNRKAHYTLMNIDAPPAAVAEMERQMGLSDDIIRILTLRVDELETEPSAMMKTRGRDDRRGPRRDRDDRRPRRDDARPPREESKPTATSNDTAGKTADAEKTPDTGKSPEATS
ncbi:SSU ribosomal protein S6p [hydrothermal vent metagenome]|uniref:SSU ribosomal protein S6p n=1 Tax=hydrothermal vent metagenome TaxID=652676 RepID=A0A3B0U136_9ZZZZ